MKPVNSLEEAAGDSVSSGFVPDVMEEVSETFSDIELLHSSGINFIARAKREGKWWILKGLNSSYRQDQGYRQMLRKEYTIMKEVYYTYVVHAESFEEVDDMGPCIIMEYIEGCSLSEWLAGHHTLKQRFQAAEALIKAVAHIHSRGIVHRDIKPGNILISRINQTVKIIDFGLADTDAYFTFKQPAGTYSYVAPEQVSTPIPDPRNDIYSLGIVLKKLLPEWRFSHIIRQCAKPAARRPQNASEILSKLRKIQTRYHNMFIYIAILFVVGISIWFLLSRGSHNQKQQTETITVQSAQAPYIEQPTPLTPQQTDSMPSTRNAPQSSTKETLSTPTTANDIVTDMGNKGCQLVNEAWKSTAMTYLDTVTDIDNAWSDWSVSIMERTRNEFLASLKQQCNDSQLICIQQLIDSQIDKNYNEWKLRRMNMQKQL